MYAVLQGRDPVIEKPGRAAPDDDIAMPQHDALRPVGAARSTEKEGGRQAERDLDDRRREIGLVAILVE